MPGNKKTDPTSARKTEHAAGLCGLDQHGRNANHYEKVLRCRQVIEDHALLSQEMPLGIKDFGVQHPFNDEDFSAALLRDGGGAGYTAGINLFWCDGMFAPTPGIPVRTETVEEIMECYATSQSPRQCPTLSSSP